MRMVEAIRAERPTWSVMRMERDEHGTEDGFLESGVFWDESQAVVEQERLERLNADPKSRYVVIEATASVVYPSDESPPWVSDPERLKRRGYEQSIE
jgi:hypothetical protein